MYHLNCLSLNLPYFQAVYFLRWEGAKLTQYSGYRCIMSYTAAKWHFVLYSFSKNSRCSPCFDFFWADTSWNIKSWDRVPKLSSNGQFRAHDVTCKTWIPISAYPPWMLIFSRWTFSAALFPRWSWGITTALGRDCSDGTEHGDL